MQLDFTGLDGLTGAAQDFTPETNEAPRLERQAQGITAERERIAAAYKEYQENVKKSEVRQAEIAKGILQGESIYTLFLKAVDAIGAMVGDRDLYNRSRDALISIYGVGLREADTLQMEYDAIMQRLEKLEAAAATSDPAHRAQLDRAIRAHRQAAAAIKGE